MNPALPEFLEQGDGDITVFLLHGVGGGKDGWPETLQALAQAGYRAIAWGMPGYGASPIIAPYSILGLALALEALIDHADSERNVVLGHSMGGMIAQEACVLFPEKVHGLILSCTSPAFGKPGGEWQQKFLQSRFAPLDAGRGMADLAPELVRGMVAPDAGAAVIAAAVALMSRVPEATYRAALSAIVSFDQRANLANIRVPALCLAGEHDKNAAPAVMEKMAAHVPGADYRCLAVVGHLANMEDPGAFNAAVLGFLKQHFAH